MTWPSKPAPWLALWAAFCAACVSGFPPCVDLPAHGAQLQTLAEVLRGGPAAAWYAPGFSVGYGLTTWLFLPAAWLVNGAFAAKLAAWTALVMIPVSVAVLARALDRPWTLGVLAAPMGFCLSYWYGFLPTLFAVPFVLFGWAHVVRGRLALVAVSGLFVLLCHFMAFAAFAAGVLALRPRFALLAAGVGVPSCVALPRIIELIQRSGAAALPTRYHLDAHLLGTVRQYPWGARVSFWLNVALLVVLVAFALRRRASVPRAAAALAASQVLLFALMPDDLAGAWRVGTRLAVFAALSCLLLWPAAAVPRALYAVPLASALFIAQVHWWFAGATAGLAEVTALAPPAGPHGGVSLIGREVPPAKLTLAEHLPEWWTARWGGVGTHFFADADHQAVRRSTAEPLPALNGVLVFGPGPLPDALAGYRVVQQAGAWRRLERPRE